MNENKTFLNKVYAWNLLSWLTRHEGSLEPQSSSWDLICRMLGMPLVVRWPFNGANKVEAGLWGWTQVLWRSFASEAAAALNLPFQEDMSLNVSMNWSSISNRILNTCSVGQSYLLAAINILKFKKTSWPGIKHAWSWLTWTPERRRDVNSSKK